MGAYFVNGSQNLWKPEYTGSPTHMGAEITMEAFACRASMGALITMEADFTNSFMTQVFSLHYY